MNHNTLTSFFAKMKGGGANPVKRVPRHALIGAAGGFLAIAMLALLTDLTAAAWIMAPFGASCVLAFGLWESPLAQPRAIVGGHLLSTFTGIAVHQLLGGGVLSMALAVGLAIGGMMLTKTTHPPAGADPLVVMMSGSSWPFLFSPVLIGSLLIVACALVLNNLDPKRRYPTFWR